MSLTRFRAYQLGSEGSSFSYFHDGHFTLIEGRITAASFPSLIDEMSKCGVSRISCLHLTSWDDDHCAPAELSWIVHHLKPLRIELPGYLPHTECGDESRKIVTAYQDASIIQWSPTVIDGLPAARERGVHDVLLWPRALSEASNDNSTAQLFRRGHFSVLSLGDLESPEIGEQIARMEVARETDVMILAHHGADNGFTSKALLEAIRPRIAICSSNYDNQYDHPKFEVRELLFEQGVDIFTTKTGDVVIQNVPDRPGLFEVVNLIADNTRVSTVKRYAAKLTLNDGSALVG